MDFINQLTDDQKYELLKLLIKNQSEGILKILIPTIPLVIGSIVTIWIFYNTKKKEINFKIHEQRKAKYEEYLEMIKQIFSNVDSINSGNLPFDRDKWIGIQFGMSLYASDKVFKKVMQLSIVSEHDDPIILVFKLGELIKLMRKEVGLNDKNISIRECLSPIIHDIYNDENTKKYKLYMKLKKWGFVIRFLPDSVVDKYKERVLK